MSEPHASPRPPRALRTLRATAAVQTVILLAQAVAAGLLLASVPVGRTVHSGMAGAVLLAVVLHLLVGVAAWRRGVVAARAVLHGVPLLLLTFVQAGLGFAHVRELHVPLGVLMFGASVMTLMRTRSQPQPPAQAPSETRTQTQTQNESAAA
ncbi:hypothetical protein [Streptomyces sp. NBC_00572]|uniref:hypothetical protein n=1 Tax=Streptomyces sp. NBC_00572 TaxID=2903664 RepID=UPI0022572E19|nr:hypothetical protein [Streptomyces sp. NBC_00572]MCX4986159.1 hypothetical protein [Streptomyces sp. NBC_00572]